MLQEKEFQRIASKNTIKVNVRVIAATNRELARAVDDRLFRSDLYYRIAVFPIELPPLRMRTDDIPPPRLVFPREAQRPMVRQDRHHYRLDHESLGRVQLA